MLGGHDGDVSLGHVPPAMGEATLERVAACAVLAGCRPAYFPVVAAAATAALDPAFNLHGQAVTTQPAGQLVVLDIRKNRGAEFLDRVETLLVAAGATTSRATKEIFSKPAAPEVIDEVARRADLVVEALAD